MSEHDEVGQEPLHPIEGFFTDLFAAKMEPPKWLIKDLLPPGLVFMGAPPKAGKSTVEMAIAALVAGYKCEALPPFLSQTETTGPVMGFSAEATAGELRHMVEVGMGLKGEANESILICDDPFMWRLDDPRGRDQLLEWLELRKPKLLFIDPLRDFHSLEEKDSGEMNRLLRPLQQWAKKTGGCVMIVHHAKKKQDGDKSERYTPDDLRGTSALFGLADAVLMISPSGKNDGMVHMHATFKRAQGWQRTFRLAAYEYAGEQATEALDATDTAVLQCVKLGLKTIDAIVGHTHVAKGRVKESVEKLRRNKLVRSTVKGLKPCRKR